MKTIIKKILFPILSFQINGEDVSAASHEHVVDLIRRSGDLVQMTVVSLGPLSNNQQPVLLPSSKSSSTLPVPASAGGGGAPPVAAGCGAAVPQGRQYATLPRKMNNTGTLGAQN